MRAPPDRAEHTCIQVGHRLCESRLLAPSGRGATGKFTQPRAHLLADHCINVVASPQPRARLLYIASKQVVQHPVPSQEIDWVLEMTFQNLCANSGQAISGQARPRKL